jgi:hypothetical protein
MGVYHPGAGGLAVPHTPDPRRTALVAHAMLDNCEGAQASWVDAVTEVARLSMPFLERQDVALVFDRASASRCAKTLDATARDRLRLLQAINDRDAETMAAVATRLLANRAAPDTERGYYLMSAMAGHLAKGRADEARVMAERSFAVLGNADRDSLAFRLLVAHAYRKPPTPAQ